MSQQEREEAENLRELLRQHWLHCRHLESERSWFMNAYAVVIGGVSAFIIGRGIESLEELETSLAFNFLIAFLIGLTLFGFFHTIRWTYAFECHRKRVSSFASLIWSNSAKTEIPSGIDPTMEIPAMEIPIPKKLKKVKEVFRTRYWFPAFYFVVLVLFAFVFPFPIKWWAIGCLLVALWLGVGFLRSKPR